MAGVAWQFEDCCLLFQEVAFLERTCEVELSAELFGLNGLLLCLGVLLTVSHGNHFFQAALEIGQLKVFIELGCVGVFNVGVAAGISDADCEWEVLSIKALLYSF